jgi:hypothetical protein
MFELLKLVGLGPANLAWVGLSALALAFGGIGLIAAFVIAPIGFFMPPVSRR